MLLPATASLSLLILFGFSTALLWNGANLSGAASLRSRDTN